MKPDSGMVRIYGHRPSSIEAKRYIGYLPEDACRKTERIDKNNKITLIYDTGNSKIRNYDWNEKCKCSNLH